MLSTGVYRSISICEGAGSPFPVSVEKSVRFPNFSLQDMRAIVYDVYDENI